jgi:hypothetical protein
VQFSFWGKALGFVPSFDCGSLDQDFSGRDFIMRFLPIVLWLLALAPAQADQTACLAAPDQTCLFDLALERALGQEDLDDSAGDLLAIAVSEEGAGSDRAGATLQKLLDLVAAREAEGLKQIAVLNGAMLGVEMAGAPKVAAALAKAVAAMETTEPTERDRLELRALVYAGEVGVVRERLAAAESGVQAGLALSSATALMQAGDYTAAFEIADLVDLDDFRSDLDETAVIILLRQGEIEAARVTAAMTEDPATQAMSLARVAKALAEDGQREAALTLIAGIEPVDTSGDFSKFRPFAEAEVLAHLGERDAAVKLLDSVAEGLIQPRRRSEVEAVAALVAGDVEGFLVILKMAERPAEGGFWAKTAVMAMLQAGQGDVEPVLPRLTPDELPYGLNALGLYQARAGDSDAALETLARLQALGEAGRMHGDFRGELSRLLLQKSRVREAVALAAEGADPRLIAELAARLPQ